MCFHGNLTIEQRAIEQTLGHIAMATPREDNATNVKRLLNSHGNQLNGTANFDSDAKIKQIVKNVIEKDKRKRSIILFNIPNNDSFHNDKCNLSNLI